MAQVLEKVRRQLTLRNLCAKAQSINLARERDTMFRMTQNTILLSMRFMPRDSSVEV